MTNQLFSVVNLVQEGEEWLRWRAGGITATDAVVLMGRHPQKTLWQLWAEKTGYAAEADISRNPHVRRGKRLEPKAREVLEQHLGDILLPVCVQNQRQPLIRASLDGLDSKGHPVEIKAPGDKVWDEIAAEGEGSQAFKQYWAQVQHQLLATLAPSGLLVFYHETHGIKEFVVTRDNAFCRDLLQAIKVFWQQVVQRIPPDKDPERDLYIPEGEEASAWKVQATRFREAELEIQQLKARIKKLEAQQEEPLEAMVGMMGDNLKADYHGVSITRYESQGAVDYRKVVDDHLDLSQDQLDGYRKASSWRQRVSVSERMAPKQIIDADVVSAAEQAVDSGHVEDQWF